jgi:hypothetical protein
VKEDYDFRRKDFQRRLAITSCAIADESLADKHSRHGWLFERRRQEDV